MSDETMPNARRLLKEKDFGILSTLSVKLDGYPFGSVVPYCLDNEGMPVIYISTIAQHTKNIKQDPRCSITITAEGDDVQASGRLCIIGDMEPLAHSNEVSERYYRHFPKSRAYSGTHDFSFYRLNPISIRYIGGFGAIHWLEPADFLLNNPFDLQAEARIVDHMNEGHLHNLINYCEHYKAMSISKQDDVRMVGIDSEGFDVFVNDLKVRFSFDAPITDAQQARKALVAMARVAAN